MFSTLKLILYFSLKAPCFHNPNYILVAFQARGALPKVHFGMKIKTNSNSCPVHHASASVEIMVASEQLDGQLGCTLLHGACG